MPLKHSDPPINPLVVIVGPSGVGKTRIAIQLARRFDAEIVSADSTLLYRGMDIGTDKPTAEEMSGVPHHLIDVSSPDEPWSLADYISAADRSIAQVQWRNKLPFVVGGTGQYIRAIIENWDIPKYPPDRRLRNALENWMKAIGPEGLHTRLQIIDPQAAVNIDPRNSRRTIRAVEVIMGTGRRFSEQRKRRTFNYQLLILGLIRPRQVLYQMVDQRIDRMISAGFAEEGRKLLKLGYDPCLPAFAAIGYREMFRYVEGEIDLDTAVQQMRKRTRIFIRHQANWFKSDDPEIVWFDLSSNGIDNLEAEVRKWLLQSYGVNHL
jgi:tRNA dimethylallyltransferase